LNNNTFSPKTKVCNTCKRELEATSDNFSSNKKAKDGFNRKCKQCVNVYAAEYRKNNKEKISISNKTRRDKIREKIKIYNSEYKAKYKHIVRLSKDKRADLIKSYDVSFSRRDWENCKNHFSYRCAYCHKEAKMTKDHFIPVSKGGEFTINNIIPCCLQCNVSKHDKYFYEWYHKQNFYSKKREQKILNYLGYKESIQQLALL
jgi:hypothetical protein